MATKSENKGFVAIFLLHKEKLPGVYKAFTGVW